MRSSIRSLQTRGNPTEELLLLLRFPSFPLSSPRDADEDEECDVDEVLHEDDDDGVVVEEDYRSEYTDAERYDR